MSPGSLAVPYVMSMAAERKPGRARLPMFTSLRGYQAGWLRGDAIAGLMVWAVLVPEALAALRRSWSSRLGRIYGFAEAVHAAQAGTSGQQAEEG